MAGSKLSIFSSATRFAKRTRLNFAVVLSYWSSFGVLLAIVSVYYLFLVSNGTLQLFADERLDKGFDNMLVHLLHGDFTVDRSAIGYEAFTHDGKTYAYFGIFPALLRLLAMPFTNVGQAHLARLSCLSALVIFVALQLRMLLIVHRSLPPASRRSVFLAVMVAATVLSGPQLYILRSAWIYNEPIFWSAAMAAGFNLIIVRAIFAEGLRGRDLVLLSVLAGLAINTRASVGGALYLCSIFFLVWTGWRQFAPDRITSQFFSKATHVSSMHVSSILLPAVILGVSAVVAGVVNFERWGNPFTFANFHYYDMRKDIYPNLIDVLNDYGEFNLGRVWIGALYYATDIPYLLHTSPYFAEFLHSRVVFIPGPPITPLLTNPLTIILAVIGLYRVWWKHELSGETVAIVRLTLLGQGAAVILVLGYWFFLARYRFDFAPFMTLAALIGYGSLSKAMTAASRSWRKRVDVFAIGLCFLGIVFSHYELLLRKVYGAEVPMNVRLELLTFAPFAHYVLVV
jgi:hypothetical protein